jgi:hypothetical protein
MGAAGGAGGAVDALPQAMAAATLASQSASPPNQ